MSAAAARDGIISRYKDQFSAIRHLASAASIFMADFGGYARIDGIAATALIALSASLEGAGLLLLVPILDSLIGQNGAWIGHTVVPWLTWAGLLTRPEKLAGLFSLFAAIVVLRAAAVWKRDVLITQLRVGFVERQRNCLVARLALAPWSHLSRISHAQVNHLLSSDIVLTGSCVHFMLQSAVSLCLLAVQCVIAFLCAPGLAAMVSLFVAGALVTLLPQLVTARRLGAAVVEGNLVLAASGARFLGGLKLAASQDVQSRFVTEFGDTLGRITRPQIAMVRAQGRTQFLFGVLTALLGGGAIFVGLVFFGMPPSLLILFVLVFARMSSPAAQLQQCAPQFVNTLASYEKIQTFAATLPHAEARPANIPAAPLQAWHSLRFNNVSYGHANGSGVFNFDITIVAGEFLGVRGPSGAGKTTFADLLVGLMAPQEGTILLDGTPLCGHGRSRWRASLAYVAQENFLFHDSIRANLLWANGKHSDGDIWSALHLTGADAVVTRVPEGLDSIVGEHGCSLSGGERQRLAISRALLSRPRLLVLDEATSALDPASEQRVLKALLSLPWNPTIVLVAHRAESLVRCTRIIELSNGRLLQRAQGAFHR